MRIQVFHYMGRDNSFSERAFGEFPAQYRKVAEVEAVDLSEAYDLTQHIVAPWTDGAQVHLTERDDAARLLAARAVRPDVNSSVVLGVRSTSVGDIFVFPGGEKRGVASVGFVPLDAMLTVQAHMRTRQQARMQLLLDDADGGVRA